MRGQHLRGCTDGRACPGAHARPNSGSDDRADPGADARSDPGAHARPNSGSHRRADPHANRHAVTGAHARPNSGSHRRANTRTRVADVRASATPNLFADTRPIHAAISRSDGQSNVDRATIHRQSDAQPDQQFHVAGPDTGANSRAHFWRVDLIEREHRNGTA